MQIRVKAGQPDVRLDKTELNQLKKALDLCNTLAVYAQDSAADDAKEALKVVIGKYTGEDVDDGRGTE